MVNNPRYPHTCTIYRVISESQFDKGKREILYEGVCRKERTYIRNPYRENVPRGDYRVSLPGFLEGILPGDMIDVKDRVGQWDDNTIVESYVSNFGSEVFFNIAKN